MSSALAILQLVLAIAEKLIPEVERQISEGKISKEEQATARANYQEFRSKFETLFEGSEWEVK